MKLPNSDVNSFDHNYVVSRTHYVVPVDSHGG